MTQGAYYSTGIGAAFGKIVDGFTDIPTAGTPVRLTTVSTPCMGVWVGGDTGNASVIYVGSSTVDGVEGQQRGISVEPAGNSVFIPVNNANLLYFDADTSGDNAVWSYLQPVTD